MVVYNWGTRQGEHLKDKTECDSESRARSGHSSGDGRQAVTAAKGNLQAPGLEQKHKRERRTPMVAYYENEAAVDAALKKAKTSQEVLKIAQDLEQRRAPSHWLQKALRVLYTMD